MLGGNKHFRPWGRFDQIMQSQKGSEWALISCSSPETRCRTVFECLQSHNITGPQLIFEIEDPLSNSTQDIEKKTDKNRNFITNLEFNDQLIAKLELMAPFKKYENVLTEFLNRIENQNLIVDITSLPKKVYFFLTKLLFGSFNKPRNIIFTYAEPESYCDQPLAANPDPWEALPGFRVSPRDENDRSVVVGIGYEPLGLPDLVDSGKYNEKQITFLFPFPAQADRIIRNWRFIRRIFPNADSGHLDIKRIDGINIPEVFETICGIGNNGQNALTLAPFGPKSVSLAMALYAARNSTAPKQAGVYYTQPTYYNPDYSKGTKTIGDHPVLNTYCIKLNGQLLY